MSKLSLSQISTLKTLDLLTKLSTSFEGISETKATELLAKHGQNVIVGAETTAWDILKRQFKSPFVFLLFGAGALSFVLGERIDAFMIALFVFINASLGFYQEYRSNQTVKLLKKYLASKIRVLRGGEERNLETSLAFDGNSGPYIQYTYARCQSVLAKSKSSLKGPTLEPKNSLEIGN